jgi:toluene monooxygenase system ferredoxin subunit
MNKLDVILKSYVFENMSDEQLHKLDSISHEETFTTGQYVFREGDQATRLYIVETGKVELQMKITPSTSQRSTSQACVEVIADLATFGWSAIAKPYIYKGSVKAVDTCKLIVIDGIKLIELMESDHDMGYEIMKRSSEIISHRLMLTRQLLCSERGLSLLS